VISAKSARPKKRANKNAANPTSPIDVGNMRRKPSVKKAAQQQSKKEQHLPELQFSEDALNIEPNLINIPSPYDTASLYSNALANQHHLEIISTTKKPPSYEDCIKSAQSIQSLHNIDNYGYSMGQYQDMSMVPQRGGPQSVHSMGDQGLSPPYSNSQSPPHSVQSNIALSPQGYIGSPSPAKSRPSLPTSPTHIQAMRYATQQKHGSNALNSIGSTNGMSSGASSAANSPSMMSTMSPLSQHQLQQGQNSQQQQQHQQQQSPLAMQQMGFEYNANGLELAGFCSPSGQASTSSQQNVAASVSGGSISNPGSQQSQNFYQYLTPPSQHSGGVTPQHMAPPSLDSYPTPSPESPGHWSSSSPHSTSDWSEPAQSPAANNIYVTSGHQANKGSEAIYI